MLLIFRVFAPALFIGTVNYLQESMTLRQIIKADKIMTNDDQRIIR